MGPSEYVSVLRSRWWAIAALVLIGAGVAWITTPSKPVAQGPLFRATTVLAKGPAASTDPADAVNLSLASSLAGSSAVIDRAAAELHLPAAVLTTGLAVNVNDKAGTLEISTANTDPALVTREADTIALQLVNFLVERRQQQIDPLIAATNDRISGFESRITALDGQIAAPGAQADLQRAERDSLVRQLSTNYDSLQLLTTQSAAAANQLAILSPSAAVPESASAGFSAPDSAPARAVIGLVVGLLAGIALVVAFERIDPKIRTTAQAEQVFGLPVIAEIPRPSRWWSRRRGGIVTFSEPYSAAAESYRGLRTALMYMPRSDDADSDGADRFANGHVVLVTSASPSEGKTTVAGNLAAGFAEKDGEVVVVSGDARHPAIESLLLGRRAAGARLAVKEQSGAVFTMIPGVKLVLACDPVTNPADIVDYEREMVQSARARSQIVIIDTPPALVANDATELMHTADSIVLVARCGSSSVASARRSAELIARLDVAVVGVVLVGTNSAVAVQPGYYRSRPRRRALQEHPRTGRPAMEFAGRRALDLVPQSPPPVSPEASSPAVDDGGIWRRKTVIDLNDGDALPPIRLPPMPEPPAAPRLPRAFVGDGFPSRDKLVSNDADTADTQRQRGASHARDGEREDLPLFRAGDGQGNGPRR